MLNLLAETVVQGSSLIGSAGLGAAGIAIGAGIVVAGGAKGIGNLAASALEGMARQPEVAGRIQTAMIIAAALIEGFTFFGLVICLLPILLGVKF
jgi:F-type H+-transporting ATPase subunit c